MSPCLLVAMWCWYLGPGSGLTRVPHCTGAGAGVRPGPGEGRCPLASLCTVTHYAILRRQQVKYSNDICDILPQNSWETSTFYKEQWQSTFPHSFQVSSLIFIIDLCVQITSQFMILQTSICIPEAWPLLGTREMSGITLFRLDSPWIKRGRQRSG